METTTNARRVEVVGSLGAVRFPNLCASCGAAPPAGDVPLEKMFRRHRRRRGNEYVFGTVRVPLCDRCLTSHARELRPVDPAVLRGMRRGWALRSLVYAIPIVVQLWLLKQLAPDALRGIPRLAAASTRTGALVDLAFPAFLLCCLAGFLWLVLQLGRPMVGGSGGDPNATYVRTLPGPLGSWYVVADSPTPTLAAVDFTDERAEVFQPGRRAFTFASPAVAEQFAALNADRVWDPAAPRGATALQKAALALLVAGALAFVAFQFAR